MLGRSNCSTTSICTRRRSALKGGLSGERGAGGRRLEAKKAAGGSLEHGDAGIAQEDAAEQEHKNAGSMRCHSRSKDTGGSGGEDNKTPSSIPFGGWSL